MHLIILLRHLLFILFVFSCRIGPFMEPQNKDLTLLMREKRKERLQKCLGTVKFRTELFV